MSRVKDERFELHYYVDFTEQDFANALVDEINSKSNIIEDDPTEFNAELMGQIKLAYSMYDTDDILTGLDRAGAITRSNTFKDGGLAILQKMYPLIQIGTGLKADKIRNGDGKKKHSTLRLAQYQELKNLWEAINQRVVLEYNIASEADFKAILHDYFMQHRHDFKPQGSMTLRTNIEFSTAAAFAVEEDSLEHHIIPLVTMSYKTFLLTLGRALHVNIQTLHQVFLDIHDDLDINAYLSFPTIRTVKDGFRKHLLDHAFSQYQIGYNKVSNRIHPTVLTNEDGIPHATINAADVGTRQDEEAKTAQQYLFEEVFYDSHLEKENITTAIKEVVVFTKIPKNSIRIPIAGGGTYSPDFAYVVEYEDGEKSLNLIVETKDKEKRALYQNEAQKIKHAEALFNSFDHDFKVSFETQFKTNAIKQVIATALAKQA
jgi:type III restriction enzyme